MYAELTEQDGPLAGVIYICDRADVAELVTRCADDSGLLAPALSMRSFSTVLEQTRAAADARSTTRRGRVTPTALQHGAVLRRRRHRGRGRRRPAGVVAATPHHDLDPQRLPRCGDRAHARRGRAVDACGERASGDGARHELRDRRGRGRAPLAPVRPRRRRGAAHPRARTAAGCGSQPRRVAAGERVYLTTQGQLVRERQWPATETYVPLTTDDAGPRVPRRSGRHVFVVGATGSGKTTSALRSAAGRAVKDNSALFFVDQKGDPAAEEFLRRLAAADRPPVHPDRPQGRGHRPLAAAVGRPAGRSRRQGPRRHRDQRAVLRRHAAPARRDRRQRPARRRLLAALVPAADRGVAARPVRSRRRARPRAPRHAPAPLAPRRTPGEVRRKRRGREGARWRPRAPGPRHGRGVAQRPCAPHRCRRRPGRRQPRPGDP